jgi:hypothetical protein
MTTLPPSLLQKSKSFPPTLPFRVSLRCEAAVVRLGVVPPPMVEDVRMDNGPFGPLAQHYK